jgi:siroheme synthase-like protein
MTYYPVCLNLSGKTVVVFGGGYVAQRKIETLLDTCARIVVVSPAVTPDIAALAQANRLTWHPRIYEPGDCVGATLVFSATNDSDARDAVFEEARALGVIVNTVDQPSLCDFIMPAVVRRGSLTVAVSTGGASPALAASLRRKLSRILGSEYGRMLELLSRIRPEIRQRIKEPKDRREVHYRIARSEILSLLRKREQEGAERRLREIIDEFVLQEETP